MMKDQHGITEIAFYDLTSEKNIMYNLILTFSLVGLASLAAFFVISLYLAKWALKPVEKSWEQQRQFIADASHELKTPLTVILANIDVLLAHKTETIQSQLKWLDYIKTEASRMIVLVNDLLFLAKSDQSKDTIISSSVDFSDLVLSCVLPFESVAYEQGKNLQIDVKPNITLLGDKGKLTQLIAILLDNAFKYSDEKGTIKVVLKKKQEKTILEITNSGEPIPAKHIPYLFERFYRADESRSRSCGGYGLGLAIAQNIANIHHGKILVKSTKQDGTTFSVIL
jgi:two-component system sensor histidine kinase CiaH